MNVLILQPDTKSAPAALLPALAAEEISYRILLEEENMALPEAAKEADALIILGGVMGADDDEDFPYLTNIKQTIRLFKEQNKAILGICLGAQLIASALGRKVETMDAPEFGLTEIVKTAEGREDPVFSVLPDSFSFMEWHNDRFNLPEGATLLASTAYCPNQAFRVNSNIYGFQFHPEVNEALLNSWVGYEGEWMASYKPEFIENLSSEVIPKLDETTQYFRQMIQVWLQAGAQKINS